MLTIFRRFYDFILPSSCPYILSTLTPEQPKVEQELPRLPKELPIEIWLDIFEFATYVHRDVTIVPLNPFIPRRTVSNVMGANTPYLAKRTKLAPVLVSKAWRNVSLPLLYRHLEIRSLIRGNGILKVLRSSMISQQDDSSNTHESIINSNGYGQWTRHVEIYTFARGADGIRYLHTVYEILKLCPKLSSFSGNWMHPLPTEFLNGVTGVLGPSLDALYWNENKHESSHRPTTIPTTPGFLGSFQSLRTLDLRLFVGSNPSTWSKTSRPTLRLLQNLILSTRKESLEIATFLSMPSLRNLTLRTPVWDPESETMLRSFLKTHGASIITIDLPTPSQDSEPDPDNATQGGTNSHVPPDLFLSQDVCPNLETLTFPVTSPPIARHIHPYLRHIGLRGGNMDGLYPDKPSQMRDHLMAINAEKYPRLELIQIVGFLVEAHTDTLIKDIFIWWVEHFEKEMGVTFLDGEGVLWGYDDEPVTENSFLPTRLKSQLDTGIIKHCD